MSNRKLIKNRDFQIVLVLLAITLIHGLLYVFLIPPWQHYDEPTHFEVVWLTARQRAIPQATEVDLEIRRAIATSMREHEFFRDAGFEPPLEDNGNIWLGISQVGNRPLYYLLAAIPLVILNLQSVLAMLYAARLVSLLFLIVSVMACWGIVAEFTPPGHRLRLLLPLTLALLPGFVDVMTAVNNDALAACLAALSLWTYLRLIRRGLSPGTLLAALALAGLIFFSKETAFTVYPLFGIALLLMIARGPLVKLRPWIWVGVGLMTVLILAWAITGGDAAAWYRVTTQDLPTRTATQKAVLGDYAFQFDANAGYSTSWFPAAVFQPQPPIHPDRNQVFTLGVWAWSNVPPSGEQSSSARLTIGFGNNQFSRIVRLSSEPTFLVVTGTMTTDEYQPFRLVLSPGFNKDATTESDLVLMDGVVLVQGEFPASQPPEFDDLNGSSGLWGGRYFKNLARNPSAEQSGYRFRPVVDRISAYLLPDQMQGSLILASVVDIVGSRQYYASAAQWLLLTFWGMFGWGHVPLLFSPPINLFIGYTLIAILISTIWVVKRLLPTSQTSIKFGDEILFMTLALVLPWLSAYLRAPMYLGQVNLYLPVARYALAAIIPTILLLNLGLHQLYSYLDHKFSTHGWIQITAGVIGWLAYAIYALVSIQAFYG